MEMTLPVVQLKVALFVVALFIILVTSNETMSQLEPRPEPVTSSVSITVPGTDGSAAAVGGTRHAQNDSLVYIPVILQPNTLTDFVQQVVDISNEERAKAGCGPLGVNLQLAEAAQGHSEDMALNDFFSHVGSNGSQFWERIDTSGYQYWSAAENIAAGYTTPEDVMAGWMNSDGHRANILNCDYQEIGVGHYFLESDMGVVNYGHYWTQVFAQPR